MVALSQGLRGIIHKMTTLRLRFSNSAISDIGFKALIAALNESLPSLKQLQLYIGSFDIVTNDTLKGLGASLQNLSPSLEEISLYLNLNVSTEECGLEQFALSLTGYYPSVQYLSLDFKFLRAIDYSEIDILADTISTCFQTSENLIFVWMMS